MLASGAGKPLEARSNIMLKKVVSERHRHELVALGCPTMTSPAESIRIMEAKLHEIIGALF